MKRAALAVGLTGGLGGCLLAVVAWFGRPLVGDEGTPPLPPNGLTPAQAVAKMNLPDGFRVSVFAAEPHCVQPFAMCFDDRGRLWVAENMHYQTRGSHLKASDAKSRLCIFEDTDGDGRFDHKKVFLDDIFFPSGLERGFGGVWVGSPPNLLFIPDRDEDDRPDGPPQVVLDGFGIEDRHETLNSFIWGPDGWLYGCHGVFTQANVGKPGTPNEQRVRFNTGWWRYHPVHDKFELFAEGGSNQWAIAFDDHGQALATACVIPHLWHVIQGGRYHRQAGPHMNPYTYDDIKTIADHKHASAHGGARVYLADNFPPEFRHRLIMGNIHEHAVLTDILERRGSGFVGHHGDNLLRSNDNLFIGFQIEIGPEGAVYVLDWYDSDICGRKVDPQLTGRIYRVTYGDVKSPTNLRLGRQSDDELIGHLFHANDWYGRQARRLLHERAVAGKLAASTTARLRTLLDERPAVPHKLRALWALHVTGGLTKDLADRLLGHDSDYLRAWTIQLLSQDGGLDDTTLARFVTLAKSDPSPLVRLYLASALQRLPVEKRWNLAEALVAHEEDATDHNLPLLYWHGIEPLVPADKVRALKLAALGKIPVVRQFVARRIAGDTDTKPSAAKPKSKAEEAEWAATLDKVAPGFRVSAVGEGGVTWMFDFHGRGVVRTHPLDRSAPCVLKRQVDLPAGKKSRLRIVVTHDDKGDWQLVVRADGKELANQLVAKNTVKDGWLELSVDLSAYAGKSVQLDLENRANNWSWEFAYWNRVELVSGE